MARLAALDTGERDRALAGIFKSLSLLHLFPIPYPYKVHTHFLQKICVLTKNWLFRIGEDKNGTARTTAPRE